MSNEQPGSYEAYLMSLQQQDRLGLAYPLERNVDPMALNADAEAALRQEREAFHAMLDRDIIFLQTSDPASPQWNARMEQTIIDVQEQDLRGFFNNFINYIPWKPVRDGRVVSSYEYDYMQAYMMEEWASPTYLNNQSGSYLRRNLSLQEIDARVRLVIEQTKEYGFIQDQDMDMLRAFMDRTTINHYEADLRNQLKKPRNRFVKARQETHVKRKVKERERILSVEAREILAPIYVWMRMTGFTHADLTT